MPVQGGGRYNCGMQRILCSFGRRIRARLVKDKPCPLSAVRVVTILGSDLALCEVHAQMLSPRAVTDPAERPPSARAVPR